MKIHSVISENNKVVISHRIGQDLPGRDTGVQNEYRVELGPFGAVSVTNLGTKHLCILHVNFDLRKTVTDNFRIDDEHILLSFFFKGNSHVRNSPECESFQLNTGILRISFQPFMDAEFKMTPEENINYMAIILSRQDFLSILEKEPWSNQYALYYQVKNEQYISLDETGLVIGSPIRALLSQIFDHAGPGRVSQYRRHFLDIKLRELFFLLYFEQTYERSSPPQALSQKTWEALENARGILSSDPMRPITIKKLGKMVSLNEQTLKTGFRSLYNITINNYISELRMKEAARLILHTDLSISQIALELGYKSISHFITVFKKYYGITPKQAALHRDTLMQHVFPQ